MPLDQAARCWLAGMQCCTIEQNGVNPVVPHQCRHGRLELGNIPLVVLPMSELGHKLVMQPQVSSNWQVGMILDLLCI